MGVMISLMINLQIYKPHINTLNVGQKYCRMLLERILQYFRPSLRYHLSLKPLFCLFLSGSLSLRQVLLYVDVRLFGALACTKITIGNNVQASHSF